ncbi:YbaK/EbsC family protein [Denitrobaculum tricleocarpae]|uniref:YbaK/EbsC family protein n=1 Tax=Denitrobaculum tricleocarpae TaxID=2591009 RepID=A0A545U278_9PROT|nr:YbaK/EbsC family protein [Denitrobaculum tricleocarpae]TQV83556.1 YbaK/EbsC family protein [Denitrobaculum tricleocarpae]
MELKASTRRVQDVLTASGGNFEVREFPASTRTAAEAAEVIGCEIAQIAKSLVFRAKDSDRSVLVIASGVNRVDVKKVRALLGEKITRADPDFVREKTGFAIGGVPPIAHREPPVTFIDRDLLEFDVIWAAAGTPNAVFPLGGEELTKLTHGTVADLRAE